MYYMRNKLASVSMTKRPSQPLSAQAESDLPRFEEFEVDDGVKFGGTKARRQESKVVCMFVSLLSSLCIFVVGVVLYTNSGEKSADASPAAPTGSVQDFNPQHNWGAYAPYFDSGVPYNGISKEALNGESTLPLGYKYKQVHVLHRHGDRFPAPGTTELMLDVADKLQNMSEPPAGEGLEWLESWNYTLGADILVGRGVANLFDSGARFWGSHGRWLYDSPSAPFWSSRLNVHANGTSRAKPVLRATTQYRIQDSARAWAAGFFGAYGRPATANPEQEYELVLQIEEQGQNNTLAGEFGCPNLEVEGAQRGKEFKKEWYNIYLKDAADRLQRALPGYQNLTPKDVLGLQDMCVFETAAYGSSAFCQLFTVKEWRGFEYHIDLKFFGDVGWGSGQGIGPATGLGWLEELLARIEGQYITESSVGVNTTLSSSSATFPLDQPFYLDVTHDTNIYAVLSALGFNWLKDDLPRDNIKAPRQNIVSRLTPFGARLYVEILTDAKGKDEQVRLKLNDRVLPLQDLKHCPDSNLGLCPLKSFVKQLEWSISSLDFEKLCYGAVDFVDSSLSQ